MYAATALVSGNDAHPALVDRAVHQALERLAAQGAPRASALLLFLTPDFAREAAAAVLTASRVADCLQVAGGTAAGLFTEEAWILDRPAAAVLALADPFGLEAAHGASPDAPGLAYGSPDHLPGPGAWLGGVYNNTQAPLPLWQGGRLLAPGPLALHLRGGRGDYAVAHGLRFLGEGGTVTQCQGHDLTQMDGQPALDALLRRLPPDLRQRSPLPLHQLTAVLADSAPATALARQEAELVPLLTANGDRSLTLAAPLRPGRQLAWAIRQPLAAEQELRDQLAALAQKVAAPDFALVFSCIGRGPYFYGGEDRDWLALKAQFPGLPLLGVYGSGQLLPRPKGRTLVHNTVLTALFSHPSETVPRV